MTPLTHDEVLEIAGPLRDIQIARILETGAEEAELMAAVAWLNADDAMGRETHEEPSGRVSILCDILQLDEPAPEEEKG